MVFYLFTFAMMTSLYTLTAYRKKAIINILFFPYIFLGVIEVFLNACNMGIEGNYFLLRQGDFYLLFYYWAIFIGCYYIEKKKHVSLRLPIMQNVKINKVVMWVILIIVGLFVTQNFDLLLLAFSNPRMFYASTRIGGGTIYFVFIPVILLLYFYYLTRIDFNKSFKCLLKCFFSTLFVLAFIYLFGQKITLLIIAIIFLTVFFFKCKSKRKNKIIFEIGIAFVIILLVVFAFYFTQQNIPVENIFMNLVSYSDYLRNFNDLVDHLDGFYYGKIFLENEVISYIPRFVWPNKPELYGSLMLGLNVPRLVEWTLALTGAPSFGALGTPYADFGFLGIIFRTIYTLLCYYIAKIYELRLEQEYNFWDHFLYFTFVGITFFQVILPIIPLYQLGVIFILYILSKKPRRKIYENFSKCNNFVAK